MDAPSVPDDERARLTELWALGVLDTPPEERLDRITRLAQRLFDVPIALVSLIDADRQWFKSNQGLNATETSREVSFCGHAILNPDVMEVPDAMGDPRFADNPLVTGDPGIRFYAGCPINGPGGAPLGTLCIIDRTPRTLTSDDIGSLRDLAGIVEEELAGRHLAAVDELTGLANRRGFDLLATKILDMSRRHGDTVTLMFVDLDGFKTINDRHGHHEGDRALKEFAAILHDTFRTSDVIARLSGDEFAILLPHTENADIAVDRLRHALEIRNLTTNSAYPLNASIGAGVFDPSGDHDLEQLLQLADHEMYADKHQPAP